MFEISIAIVVSDSEALPIVITVILVIGRKNFRKGAY